MLEAAIDSLTQEFSELYSGRQSDNYKISVACAFFFKFYNQLAAKIMPQVFTSGYLFQ